MQPFKRILVAVDFSPHSDEALRQGHERASSTGAELAVCHIVPNELRSNLLFPHLSRSEALNTPVELTKAVRAVEQRAADVTGRTGDQVTVLVDHGSPYAELLKQAEDWKADLIIIGSHGMTSASSVLLGSVTHKIIRYAHCAVLVARTGKGGGPIVAGTDFSDPALPAVAAAVYESQRTGKALTVVHAVDFVWSTASHGAMGFGGPEPTMTAADFAELEQAARERITEALSKFNATGDARIATGPAGTALVAAAQELQADLLVVGTVGRTGLTRVLLGSVAENVASHAPCSVMITRLHPHRSL